MSYNTKLFAVAFFWIISILFSLTDLALLTIMISNLVLFLGILYQVRAQPPILATLVFLFSYFCYYFYFLIGYKLGPYVLYQHEYYYIYSNYLWLCFLSGFFFFIKPEFSRLQHSYDLGRELISKFPNSNVLFYFYFSICTFIITKLIFDSSNVIFSTSKYQAYLDNLDSVGGISVLFFCFYVTASLYINPFRTGFKRLLLYAITVVYIYFSITRGMRMLFVSILMVNYILFFYNKFDCKRVIIMMLMGFLLLLSINKLKHDIVDDGQLYNLNGEKYVLVNQAQILYGGAAAIGAVEDKLFTLHDRLGVSAGLLLESIIPPTFLPRDIKYPSVLHDRVDFGGGGLFIFVVYIASGPIGVIVLGSLLSVGISRICLHHRTLNRFELLFFILSLCLATRWISYDFNVMYRLPIFTCILVLFIDFIFYKNKRVQ
ncbi:hypothetical protein AB4248_25830 [Vibrio splendidus]